MAQDDDSFEPQDGEWWLVYDKEGKEEVKAQWNGRRQFWRLQYGDTLHRMYLDPLRRTEAPRNIPWLRDDWVD